MRTPTKKRLERSVRLLITAALLLPVLAVAIPSSAVPSVDASRSQLEKAKEQLGEMQEQQEILAEEYNAAKAKLEATQKSLEQAQEDMDQYGAEAADKQAELSTRAADAYRAGVGSRLQVVFGGGTFNDFSDRITFLSSMADETEALALEASNATVKATQAAEVLKKAKEEIEKQKKILEEKQAEIEKNIAAQNALVQKYEIQLDAAIQAAEAAAAAAAAAQENATGGTGGTTVSTGGEESFNPPPASSAASTAVSVALAQQGDSYQWGAAGPDEFDCSGLMVYAWGQAGVSLTHSSSGQYASLPHVSRDQLQPGDLVFFYNPIHHVGMYIGGGMMVHAYSEGHPVETESVFGGYYGSVYTGAARPG